MFVLTSPHVAGDIGEARWSQAADALGEAVAFELKERVFGAFAVATQVTPTDDHWKRVLSRQATVGQMIECLLQTRHPIHEAAKQLSDWFGIALPRLQGQIQKVPQQRLRKFARLRGQAQHDSTTESETRAVSTADLLLPWFLPMTGIEIAAEPTAQSAAADAPGRTSRAPATADRTPAARTGR
jgi:hypothetical protein